MVKKKILIAEDDSFLLSMYANKFEMDGFTVFTAEDGKKALRTALKEQPDLILLDLMLPAMDGFEVLKELKNDAKAKEIPVILLTNLSQRDEIDRGLELGAMDYLIKAHVMPSEVVEKVKTILKA
jgi:DNA-binding response OmpR family regulator